MLSHAPAADFIVQNGGLDTEADYSYWGMGTVCNPLREGRWEFAADKLQLLAWHTCHRAASEGS